MSNLLRNILFLVWPPYEAHIARKVIDNRTSNKLQERMKSIVEIRESLPEDVKQQEELESFAKRVFESENERKETLEDKALAFVSAFGVSVSIVSALPVFLSKEWSISTPIALILGIFYVLAIIHLLVAVYYSVGARRVEGLALPSADGFVEAVKEGRQSIADRIVMYVYKAKFNEPTLTKKSNSLAVAESMFLRGLILVAMVSITGAGTVLFTASSTPSEICEVPNTVGLDQAAAENMLTELGLQPILSNQYDSDATTGSVISQHPPPGSRIQPCEGGVAIVISLGSAPTPPPTSVPINTPRPTETPTLIPPTP